MCCKIHGLRVRVSLLHAACIQTVSSNDCCCGHPASARSYVVGFAGQLSIPIRLVGWESVTNGRTA